MNESVDAVGIVGAGFAGLAAALMLRRHRRSVVVFDGGPARNARARAVHGYLGVPHRSGAELQQTARQQAEEVGARIVPARVDEVQRAEDGFLVCAPDGRRWPVQRLLLATGVRDTYPDIDYFFDFFGSSVHVCPHCDAYEWRDQPIAIVAWSPSALPFALEFRQWTSRITVVTDGRAPELTPNERSQLADHGIRVLTQTVRRFEGQDGQLSGLRFEDGTTLPVRAAFFNIASTFETDLARQLGCATEPAGCLVVDEHLRTTVDGVWAAGDVAGEEQLVAVAAAQGVRAAIDIDRTLPAHAV